MRRLFVIERVAAAHRRDARGARLGELSRRRRTHASRMAHFVVNDVAMVFFFALAAKEIVEATPPGGPLRRAGGAVPLLGRPPDDRAGRSLRAARSRSDAPELYRGWAIPCATDIAFSYMVARGDLSAAPSRASVPAAARGGRRCPGLVILAVVLSARVLSLLAIVALCSSRRRAGVVAAPAQGRELLAVRARRRIAGLGRVSIRRLHPALALVPIVPFMPRGAALSRAGDEPAAGPADTLDLFASWWRVPVQIVLFFFGLANAGVPLSSVGPVTWMVAGALVAGKPLGVLLLTFIGVAAGLKRPGGLTYADTAIVGITAGIGFTVALFFATAAFPAGPILDQAKMGALLSFIAAPIAILAGRASRSTHRARSQART
jgi:NhaA family Na+:H+ antiporter